MRTSYAVLVTGFCVVGAGYALTRRRGPAAPPAVSTPAVDAGSPEPLESLRVQRARALIERIGQGSNALMPEGFENVYVGMGVEALRAARPGVRLGRPTERSAVWEETTESGARVVFLASNAVGVVTQVQFLSRLEAPAELLPHFQALRRRYGEPTGFWDCPEQPDASPIRRITWRRDAASVTEAILVHSGGVSVTLMVGATGDVPVALARSHCTPVTRESLAQWPIASELRGERIPFTNAR